MLQFNVEKNEKHPKYEALYENIRDYILNGILKEKEKLPSKRAMAKTLGISVTTVENAYSQLLIEGYIHSEPGRGFFVNGLDSTLSSLVGSHQEGQVFSDDEADEEEYAVDFKSNQSSLAQFPFATWSHLMRNVLSSDETELLKTVPYNGLYPLRLAIARHLFYFRNMKVDPAQIIIGAGTEFLYGRLMQLLGNDSIYAIEDPGYKKFADISGSQGTLWDYIPIDEQGMRIDRLRRSRANIIHISPANHFPTGIVMPISRRMQLLEWVYEDSNRFIIEDDYDSELRYTGKMIPTLYAIDDRNKVIYMNTFSKSLVPSIRISYMVLPPLLMNRYKKSLSFYSCTVSAFEQLTLASFISEHYFERHLSRMKQYYREKRDMIIDEIEKSPLSKVSRIGEANAGTHFLLRMDTYMTDDQIRDAAKSQHIHLALLSDYETIHTVKNSRTLVINYAGLNQENVSLAVNILEKIFKTDIEKNM